MADGSVEIEALLTTDKFDKQIIGLEKKIEKTEKKGLEVDTEIKGVKESIANYEALREEVWKTAKEIERLKKLPKEVGGIRASDILPQLNEQKTRYEELTSELKKQNSEYVKSQEKLSRLTAKRAELTTEAKNYRNQVEAVKLQKQQAEIEKIKGGFNSVGNSLKDAVKTTAKLALGIFSIRSAYMLVRNASSELASYDKQYATNLEYIRFALAQLIAPVLEYIVNLARTVLAYINYIANAWFGVNLFSRASAENFKKIKNNIGGASASAKALRKTLAGFDEMNILNSNSTGGGGGVGGGGGLSPDFDLSDLDNVEIPDWIKWIAENKDLIIGAIAGIAGAFLLFKTLQITGILSTLTKNVTGFIKSLGLLRGTLFAVGIATIIAGVVIAIKGLIDYIKNPSWKNFKTILYGLETALLGVSAVLIALNTSNPIGWVILGIDAIALLTTKIADMIIKEKDEMTTEEKLQKSVDDLRRSRERLTNATKEYIGAVDGAEDAEKRLQEAQDETGISIDDLLEKMDTENLTYKDLTKAEKEVYKAYMDNKTAQEELAKTTQKMAFATLQEEDNVYQVIKALMESSDSHDDYKKKVVDAWKSGQISAKDATKAISIALADMDDTSRQVFTKDLPNNIKSGLNPNNYQAEANKFKNWWNNGFWGNLSTKLNLIINARASGLFSTGNYTKMASGGIVNMPNKGVMLGTGAIVGEAGRERNNSTNRPDKQWKS